VANGASEEDQVGGDLDLGLQLLAAQQHAPGQALTWPQRRVLRLAASDMASAARPPVGRVGAEENGGKLPAFVHHSRKLTGMESVVACGCGRVVACGCDEMRWRLRCGGPSG
jgi:hypothetical protein